MNFPKVAQEISKCFNEPVERTMASWPRLSDGSCRIYRSRASRGQNCHGYALRVGYWFEATSFERYAKYLVSRGYLEDTSEGFQCDLKKIAIYLGDNDDVVLHTAKQIEGGWLSKLGCGPVVFHKTPDDIGGGMYGEPELFFAKKVKRGAPKEYENNAK